MIIDIVKSEMSKVVATVLWDMGAIKISTNEPFRLASGNVSPIYIDCRILISYPLAREIITTFACLLYESGCLAADYIAGGETAGIPYAAWLADRLRKPLIYVRKEPKDHGTKSQIEGNLELGNRVLLYEDLITDGKSKLNFIEGIRKAGCIVENCLVVFDRQQGGYDLLRRQGVTLYSLTHLDECLNVGVQKSYLHLEELNKVKDYLMDAQKWHEERGYRFVES